MAWINRRWPAWKKTVLMERSTKAPKSASKRERETAVDGTKIGIGVVSNLNTRPDGYCYGWLLLYFQAKSQQDVVFLTGTASKRDGQEERDGGIDGIAEGCRAEGCRLHRPSTVSITVSIEDLA